jgi:hypothetical protein
MKRRVVLVAALLTGGIGFAGLVLAQRSAPESKFLTIGDVSKIDLKKKFITIKDATSYDITQLSGSGGNSAGSGGGGRGGGGRGGGGRGGGGGGRGGGRRGAGGEGGGVPSGPRVPSAPIPTEFKVKVSAQTPIRDGNNEIKIDDLKIGDRIQVISMKGGSKLNASEINRTPKGSP